MTHPWDELVTDIPQPGSVADVGHGIEGPEVALPLDDAEQDEATQVNDE